MKLNYLKKSFKRKIKKSEIKMPLYKIVSAIQECLLCDYYDPEGYDCECENFNIFKFDSDKYYILIKKYRR